MFCSCLFFACSVATRPLTSTRRMRVCPGVGDNGHFTTPPGRKAGRSLAVEQQLRKKIIELKTDSAFWCVIWVDKGLSCRRKMNHEEGRRLYEEQGPALLGYACDLLGARASAVSSVKR